ncbi:MAG: hypothetical protein VW397_04020 [Candidatus Margulisiibacteriota bacterium]
MERYHNEEHIYKDLMDYIFHKLSAYYGNAEVYSNYIAKLLAHLIGYKAHVNVSILKYRKYKAINQL